MYDISQLARSGRGLTRLGVAYAVIALGAGTAQFGVEAQEQNARYRPQRAMAGPADTDQKQLPARQSREASDQRRQSGMYVFLSPRGHEIMTNNPAKFRNRPGYKEVSPDFKRTRNPVQPTYQMNSNVPVRVVDSVRGIPEDIRRHVTYHARLNGLDTNLVYAVIMAESSLNPNAQSSKGAQGLMQLMPGTAAQMGVRDPFDPGENIRGGTRYLRLLLDRFNNDLHLALAGYNAGPEKVKEYGGIPPYDETQNFIRRVIANRSEFSDGGATNAVFAVDTTPRAKPASGKLPVVSDRRPRDFLVHFTSGHVQQADKVVESGDEYYIQYKNQSFLVHKSLVSSVSQAS